MTPKQHFDVIVLGTGGIGSAAVCALASRGARVLGIDLFPPGHQRGSSHGQTRAIRQAYFEHPNYVPLTMAAYDLWHALEQKTEQTLLTQTGLLQAGPPDGHVVRGVLDAAAQHHLAIDRLDPLEANDRFAPLRFSEDHRVLFERHAGYLRVEECVKAHLAAAESAGAMLVVGQRIVDWTSDERGIRVVLESQDYRSQKLIITLGAGSRELWKLPLPITVLKKHQYWFQETAAVDDRLSRIPIFLVETSNDVFYGFPRVDELGLKVARHTGGNVVRENPFIQIVPADEREEKEDLALVTSWVADFMPNQNLALRHHSACWYSMTTDGHFFVGRHPEYRNVFLAAGLSGHGFKFAPVLGQALADLALDGDTSYPIEFLDPRR